MDVRSGDGPPRHRAVVRWRRRPGDAGADPIRSTITWSNVWLGLAGVDGAATLSNCYLGVYDTAGTLRAVTADISVNAGLAAPNLRYSNMLTGQTSLPASLTLASQSTSIINTGWASQWYGVS
ncbi:hypothetical protein [Streptomyces sp. NPDC001389]|uniref:hypothetical protein n=1 Tax=Streptomyces sp. NPDC001389 TaxID=3364569 RepID=UPI00369919A0